MGSGSGGAFSKMLKPSASSMPTPLALMPGLKKKDKGSKRKSSSKSDGGGVGVAMGVPGVGVSGDHPPTPAPVAVATVKSPGAGLATNSILSASFS